MGLGDTDQEELLVEAHLFEPLLFQGGLAEMCISVQDRQMTYWENNQEKSRPLTDAELQQIGINARKFAQKHECGLVFLE
jgi:hypothetical protein